MTKNSLHNRASSCCPKIVKMLCAQICELETKVLQLQTEMEDTCNELELTRHQLEQAQTQRDELSYRLDYFRVNGCEPDDEW